MSYKYFKCQIHTLSCVYTQQLNVRFWMSVCMPVIIMYIFECFSVVQLTFMTLIASCYDTDLLCSTRSHTHTYIHLHAWGGVEAGGDIDKVVWVKDLFFGSILTHTYVCNFNYIYTHMYTCSFNYWSFVVAFWLPTAENA